MDMFSDMDPETRKKVVSCWTKMKEDDKCHFINQMSLGLSVWGDDDAGKKIALGILYALVQDGAGTLSDFGLYLDKVLNQKEAKDRLDRVKRASLIIEGYRLKNALSSEPHKDIGI
jgi:hypothetical protein